MDITEFMFGSNSNVAVLQIIIIILALVIIGLLFSETHDITDKIDKFKCPACPACNCDHKNECPDCICEKGETAVECPTCPTCPEAPECPKLPDKGTGTIVKDILDGIFPGKNRGITKDGKYFPQMMADEANKFIEKNRDKPFFMYYALNTPHYPYQGYAKWLKHYAKLPYPRNLYAAFLSTQDETIGNLLATLDRLKLREDTIIVFQSDHGHSHEERAHFGGGSSGPYRGAKFSMFEGGIRVPAIISWPNNLPEGAVRDQVAHSCDWLPTLAQLTGVKLLHKDIDGKSIVSVIKNDKAKTPHDVLHWQLGRGNNPRWAIRQGDWKLIGNPQDTSKKAPITPTDKLFLVNLKENINEMKNLASEHPETTQRLKKLHDNWSANLKN